MSAYAGTKEESTADLPVLSSFVPFYLLSLPCDKIQTLQLIVQDGV